MNVGDLLQDGTAERDEGRMMKEDMPQDYFFVWKKHEKLRQTVCVGYNKHSDCKMFSPHWYFYFNWPHPANLIQEWIIYSMF